MDPAEGWRRQLVEQRRRQRLTTPLSGPLSPTLVHTASPAIHVYTVSTILNSLLAVQEEGTGGSRVIIAHHHEKEGGVIDERCPVAHHS